jgi:sugar phosphate isomerase/epimerase
MKIKEILHPSILISGFFYPYMNDKSKLEKIIDRLAADEFYERIETRVIQEKSLIKKVRDTAERCGWEITQWATHDLFKEGLNPASTDLSIQKRTVQKLKEMIEKSAECGTKNFALISGNDPGDAKREDAKIAFSEVIYALCEKVKEFNDMSLLIEPLDRFAHKKNLIGPTGESLDFLSQLHKYGLPVYLCWDSAHVALNEEDLIQSIKECSRYISQIHLANAVLDKSSKYYGDWHIPIGEQGFLDEKCAYKILNQAAKLQMAPGKHYVAIETRCTFGEDSWEQELKYRKFLSDIMDKEVVE